MRKPESPHRDTLSRRLRPGQALALGAAVTFAAGAGAQESGVMQEITVTATKRSESVQDVAISMAAYSGDQLREFGLQESTDVARLTPGVFIGGSIGGQTSLFTIRGVTQNDFTDSVESPVAVYIDEGYVAMGQGQMFGLFDIERVEVAKGPQGTLFGRNATGGLVHYISRKPTRELEGYVDLSFAEYSSVRAEGAVSGPISDTVAGRLSFLYNRFDPVLNNVINRSTLPGGLGGDDEWNDKTYAVRAQLLLTPRESSEITLAAFGAKSDVSTAPYQSSPTVPVFDQQGRLVDTINASPTETREAILLDASGRDTGLAAGIHFVDGDFDTSRPVPGGDLFGYVDADGEGFNYSKDFAFDNLDEFETKGASVRWYEQFANGMSFASITDYKTYDKFVNMDVDAAPYPQALFYSQAEVDTITQEFRLSGDTGRMKWVTGLYYLNIDNQTRNGLGFPAGSPFTVPQAFGGFGTATDTVGFINLDTTSYSLFGQVDVKLADRWTLVAGARGVKEKKDYSFEQAAFVDTDPRSLLSQR